MDLVAHTERSLDTAVVRAALVECAATARGKRELGAAGPVAGAAAARALYGAVDEWTALAARRGAPSLGGAADIGDAVIGAAKGELLDAQTLQAIGRTLEVADRAARHLLADDELRSLADVASGIAVDPGVLADLLAAFEPDGRLSERAYPSLGELRRTVNAIHGNLRSTLESLSKGEELADDLQDTFWTMRNDRYVLPLKPHARARGVVHGTSGSGKTVFVEPHAVVELNNRLRLAEGALVAEERRILAALSRAVGACAPEIADTLRALAALDGIGARAELGRRLRAVVPVVGEQGVVALRDARHPVLVLRGVDVVGHDLGLDAARPALVLTGPNTGGKTVALKTTGLAVWMVRHAIPVPAAEGARVDWFDAVLADVGDAQTVTDDLSSFSAQLVAVREMLDRAGPGVLLLLDELASGTDPAQGAALAQAVLEALVSAGARVVTTTHYPPLKGLATTDPRFSVAAMEVREGRPTYRLIPGATGESHALSTAGRLGIDAALVERASALLRDTDRGFSDALAALELQRAELADREQALASAQAEVDALRRELAVRSEEIRARARELEARSASAFQDRLRAAERAIGAVVAQLQANPTHRAATAARQTLQAFSELLPAEPDAPVAAAPRALQPGDRVRHPTLGSGEVVAVGRTVRVRGRSMEFGARPDALELLEPAPAATAPPAPVREASAPARERDLAYALRVPANTVDLRGMRVDEALDLVATGLDRAVSEGLDVLFVLHGHGTGALKTAVRAALRDLPAVRRWAPANADQGGDAYTVVAVRA